MSSFWATVRCRKSSGNVNPEDVGKPPSGRSSNSKVGGSQNASPSLTRKAKDPQMTREDSDEEVKNKGCLRISRLAEQVLPRRPINIRLPSALSKGFRTSSLPRHMSRQVDNTPPTPVPTPEPDFTESPKSDFLKPPIPESPKPKVKGFRKRAASASPSRQGQKRKILRGLSRERLVGPLPAPLRNFLLGRQSKVLPKDETPLKPSRRPGPLGRSWVKVYNDITYMDDDISQTYYPIPGYTGQPTKIPDAEPLPVAPTPPPPREKREAMMIGSSDSVTSEYDNVPKLEKTPVTIEVNENIPNKDSEQQDSVETSNNRTKGEENIHNEIFIQKENEEINEAEYKTSPKTVERPSRSREATRYKAKKKKRPPTPVGREAVLLSPDEVLAEQANIMIPSVPDNTPDEVMEDGYIIPQSLKPAKPPRGNKTYESLDSSKEKPSQVTNAISLTENEEKNTKVDHLISNLTNETQHPPPPRPKRGAKIYENLNMKEEAPEHPKQITELTVNEILEIGNEDLEETRMKSSDDGSPLKPKRGVKIYENIKLYSNSQENIAPPSSTIDTDANGTSSTSCSLPGIPPRPSRGNKIYATLDLNSTGSENREANEHEILLSELDRDIESKKSIIDENETLCQNFDYQKTTPTTDNNLHVYAKVVKDRHSKDLREITLVDDCVPPPIPPKKKDMRTLSNITQFVNEMAPPRPPRHLKPRPRSLDVSPARLKRQRVITLLNEHSSPARPERGAINYAGFNLQSTSDDLETPTSHRRKIMHSNRPLPAPPRKKKSPHVEGRSQRNTTLKSVDNSTIIQDPLINKEAKPKNEENNSLRISRERRGRPLPPLPDMHAKFEGNNDHLTDNLNIVETPQFNSHENNSLSFTHSKKESQLDVEIDANLKNIEASFATLDTVLSSLQKYSRTSPARNIFKENRRLSCDIICEFSLNTPEEVKHSINNEKDLADSIANIEISSGIFSIPPITTESPGILDHTINIQHSHKDAYHELFNMPKNTYDEFGPSPVLNSRLELTTSNNRESTEQCKLIPHLEYLSHGEGVTHQQTISDVTTSCKGLSLGESTDKLFSLSLLASKALPDVNRAYPVEKGYEKHSLDSRDSYCKYEAQSQIITNAQEDVQISDVLEQVKVEATESEICQTKSKNEKEIENSLLLQETQNEISSKQERNIIRPLKSKVILDIQGKLCEQISPETHHLIMENIRDSVEVYEIPVEVSEVPEKMPEVNAEESEVPEKMFDVRVEAPKAAGELTEFPVRMSEHAVKVPEVPVKVSTNPDLSEAHLSILKPKDELQSYQADSSDEIEEEVDTMKQILIIGAISNKPTDPSNVTQPIRIVSEHVENINLETRNLPNTFPMETNVAFNVGTINSKNDVKIEETCDVDPLTQLKFRESSTTNANKSEIPSNGDCKNGKNPDKISIVDFLKASSSIITIDQPSVAGTKLSSFEQNCGDGKQSAMSNIVTEALPVVQKVQIVSELLENVQSEMQPFTDDPSLEKKNDQHEIPVIPPTDRNIEDNLAMEVGEEPNESLPDREEFLLDINEALPQSTINQSHIGSSVPLESSLDISFAIDKIMERSNIRNLEKISDTTITKDQEPKNQPVRSDGTAAKEFHVGRPSEKSPCRDQNVVDACTDDQEDESSGDWSQGSSCTVKEVRVCHTPDKVEPIETPSGKIQIQCDKSKLLDGVADITGKLEGIRSQIEQVISNYAPSSIFSDSSFEYTSSESPSSSSVSNRSSIDIDCLETASTATFYSLSQPSISNYSMLSFYSAMSLPTPAFDLPDSPTNTRSSISSSFRAEDGDITSSSEEETETQ